MNIRHTKNIVLRAVELSDAEFIYNLRADPNKNKYISSVEGGLKNQEEWIRNYKMREREGSEYYFIIENNESRRIGVVRVYDFTATSFCWGSWILSNDAMVSAALESAITIYEFGFFGLGYKHCHFDVRKGNDKVISFHKKLGAIEHDSDERDIFFSYPIIEYEKIRKKYSKYLAIEK